MPFDKQAIFDSQVQHLVSMVRTARKARVPGLLEYARERAAELEADQSGLFVGLVLAVRSTLAIGGQVEASECEAQKSTKHP